MQVHGLSIMQKKILLVNNNKRLFESEKTTFFIPTGMECLDKRPSVAARNCQISSLHPSPQVSAVRLPQRPTVSEMEESLFKQLMSADFGLPKSPAALNPNKVILTIDHETQEVLSVHVM